MWRAEVERLCLLDADGGLGRYNRFCNCGMGSLCPVSLDVLRLGGERPKRMERPVAICNVVCFFCGIDDVLPTGVLLPNTHADTGS